MTLLRLLMVVLLAVVMATPGCRRAANESVAYKDEIPPPEEPLIKQLPSVGRYGGRFVLGETNNPRTFNAMMAKHSAIRYVVEIRNIRVIRSRPHRLL